MVLFSLGEKRPKFRVKEVRGFTYGENLIESIRGSTLKHTVILNNLQKIGTIENLQSSENESSGDLS